MKFAIITQVPHLIENPAYWSYAPYVREMNIWLKYTDVVIVVAPVASKPKSAVDMAYEHGNIDFRRISDFNIQSIGSIAKALWKIPRISFSIFRAMRDADHIHLRCPGNIGLLGCFIQILFPNKPKTAKYAGNWDPKSAQPWSYKLQRWLLSNTFLTKNMKVLVYGHWENSKNIQPFFTATYKDSDKVAIEPRTLGAEIKMLFVGTLAHGKRPMYAAQIAKALNDSGYHVTLEMYGEGKERQALERFIADENLQGKIILKGNQPEAVVRNAYQTSHFLILPSQSEGWPKVVAEAMFWGCVPLASEVSCVPDMLGNGTRGILLQTVDADRDTDRIVFVARDAQRYRTMAESGMEWSRQYTFDVFESAIKKILTNG